ncbi:hypothetical protein DFH06DRAFT_1255858 [Mycena polygramma]|nr:hypothetical protein DFH06DRAFT_1255858 [Mycena polygramma]
MMNMSPRHPNAAGGSADRGLRPPVTVYTYLPWRHWVAGCHPGGPICLQVRRTNIFSHSLSRSALVESRQPPCAGKGSRTAIDCFSVPEKDQSSRSAGRQHISEHHTTLLPNTVPNTTIHGKKPQKGLVVATGCTEATEEEGLGDSFKDLDEYLQSLCQFVVEPEHL